MRAPNIFIHSRRFWPAAIVAVLAVLALGASGCSYRSSSQPQVSDTGAKATDVSLEFKTLPARSVAGEACIWDIKVLDNATGKGFKSYADRNGQQLRFAVLSTDGKAFQLVEPDYKDYGHFVFQGTFAQGGPHRAFALFTPFGGAPIFKGIEFLVAPSGTHIDPQPLTLDLTPAPKKKGDQNILKPLTVPDSLRVDKSSGGQIEKRAGGLRVSLHTAELRAGQSTNLTIVLHDDAGRPASDTEPVLGAPLQLVATSADATAALAPELIGGTGVRGQAAVFQALFPKGGPYTLWTQFARGGRTWTVPFTIRVAPLAVAPASRKTETPTALRAKSS